MTDSKKIYWPTNKEFLKHCKKKFYIMYITGIISIKKHKKYFGDGNYVYDYKYNWWNPLNYILFLLILIWNILLTTMIFIVDLIKVISNSVGLFIYSDSLEVNKDLFNNKK